MNGRIILFTLGFLCIHYLQSNGPLVKTLHSGYMRKRKNDWDTKFISDGWL